MSELLWRAPARVSVSGPADWAPAEQVDVHHRDGDAVVRVETWPVDAEADLLAAEDDEGNVLQLFAQMLPPSKQHLPIVRKQ